MSLHSGSTSLDACQVVPAWCLRVANNENTVLWVDASHLGLRPQSGNSSSRGGFHQRVSN